MRLQTSPLMFAAFAAAKLLVNYDASRGDPASNLGLVNWDCYEEAECPDSFGTKGNASLYFKTDQDPDGIPAAHVHKQAHFGRAEYHMLKGQTVKDTTYYIGYKVRWDASDWQLLVFQWKNYNPDYTTKDNIPATLVFRRNGGGDSTDGGPNDFFNITWAVRPDPENKLKGGAVWSKQLYKGNIYQFGIVINTSQTKGFVQLYFNGRLSTMIDPNTGEHTQKLAGNYFPGGIQGAADPKVGLYGRTNPWNIDSYIYNVVIATTLDEIRDVAGIPKDS